jgi:hypothetical protein
MTRLRFKVLGPLEFYDGNCWATLPAPKWRAVLALLLINQNQIVALEQIIDELWGDDLPAEPNLTAFELTGGRYELAAKVTGDDVFSAQRPFAVEVRPSDLVARLRRAGPPPGQAT